MLPRPATARQLKELALADPTNFVDATPPVPVGGEEFYDGGWILVSAVGIAKLEAAV